MRQNKPKALLTKKRSIHWRSGPREMWKSLHCFIKAHHQKKMLVTNRSTIKLWLREKIICVIWKENLHLRRKLWLIPRAQKSSAPLIEAMLMHLTLLTRLLRFVHDFWCLWWYRSNWNRWEDIPYNLFHCKSCLLMQKANSFFLCPESRSRRLKENGNFYCGYLLSHFHC